MKTLIAILAALFGKFVEQLFKKPTEKKETFEDVKKGLDNPDDVFTSDDW